MTTSCHAQRTRALSALTGVVVVFVACLAGLPTAAQAATVQVEVLDAAGRFVTGNDRARDLLTPALEAASLKAPKSTWSCSPARIPAVSSLIAVGWSPAGWNGADMTKRRPPSSLGLVSTSGRSVRALMLLCGIARLSESGERQI